MKDEFVMVPRELAEVAGRALRSNGYDLQARDLEAALSLQPRSEPVLYYKPLSGAEAKPTGKCYSVFFVPMPGHQPLYTHADPAEVERLRDENRRLQEAGEFLDGVNQSIEDKLRAQLAEAHALLHAIRTGVLHDGWSVGCAIPGRIDAALERKP